MAFLFCCNRVAAQLPVEQEPYHKIVLENEYVRILDGLIPAHDTTLPHIHAANSVVVFLSKSTFGIQNIGEKSFISNVNTGDIVYRNYGEKPVNHKVWNQDTFMFHFMVVELVKQDIENNTCSIVSQPGIKLQWQKKLVSAYKLDVTKGKNIYLKKSNCTYLLLDISGVIKVASSGNIQTIQTGGFVFFPPQKEIKINNKIKENAICVLLELK